VFLRIITGIALGHWFPLPFQLLSRLEVAQVNLPATSCWSQRPVPPWVSLMNNATKNVLIGMKIFGKWNAEHVRSGLFADSLNG
jgi:ACR3 family arsenite efflux pump ArsB